MHSVCCFLHIFYGIIFLLFHFFVFISHSIRRRCYATVCCCKLHISLRFLSPYYNLLHTCFHVMHCGCNCFPCMHTCDVGVCTFSITPSLIVYIPKSQTTKGIQQHISCANIAMFERISCIPFMNYSIVNIISHVV